MGVRDWLFLFVAGALLALGLWQSHSKVTTPEPDIFGPHCVVPGIPETCLRTR
jgi:hypothetical protein